MPQNLICRHTVGAVAAQPDREARGPALGTRGKCPGAARELRGTRKRHTGKNGILPSGAATYNDSAVASSGVSGTIVSHRGRSGRDARWRRAVRVAHVFGTCETAAWAHFRLHVGAGAMLRADRVAEITGNGPCTPKFLARILHYALRLRSEPSYLWRPLPVENPSTRDV